jgi:antitoxin MazE
MKVELVRIGNSRGIRIPKPILEQCGFEHAVELRIENDRLVIAQAHLPREGWEEAFRAAGPSTHDEVPLDTLPANQFDRDQLRAIDCQRLVRKLGRISPRTAAAISKVLVEMFTRQKT